MAKTHRGNNYLFDLPKDCLLDILERCDHDDLDEFSETSRAACRLAEESRPHIPKIVASELFIKQEPDDFFHIKMKIKRSESSTSYYVLRMTSESEGVFRKQKFEEYMERFPIPKSNFVEALDRLDLIIGKFEFESIEIEKIPIDDRLLATLEEAIGDPLNHLSIRGCTIDRNLNQQRFTEILFTAKLKRMHLDFDSEASFFDLDFVKNYARIVPFPTISISSEDQEPLLADLDFIETLAQFDNINIPRFAVNADWILPVLLGRLRNRKEGRWYFQTTRNIARTDVAAALVDSALTYRSSSGGHIVEIPDTNHSVFLITTLIYDGHRRQWELSAMFQ